jgi:23S rRNA (cytidine1920-2'-O)/16S rRNA (cytidine1409-2'-O)-methyltransferase
MASTQLVEKYFPMRLDLALVAKAMVASRTRADEYIKSGFVTVNARRVDKAATIVSADDVLIISEVNPYVSRAALKILSANKRFRIDFTDKVVLDVGSSTGGFTDYALKHGAKKVIAVDVGTDQMHFSLREDPRIELHEKTDIRDYVKTYKESVDLVVCDVSFISLKMVVKDILRICSPQTKLLLMCKPQFEAGKEHINKGVVKNEAMRRRILSEFESWLKTVAVVIDKADSDIAGEKGNVERFFLVQPSVKR